MRTIISVIVLSAACLLLVSCSSPLNQGKSAFQSGSYGEAYAKLLPLADKGNAKAQYAVGYMYYNGLGVKRDSQTAVDWFQRAAKNGSEPAKKSLKMIKHSRELSPFPAPHGILPTS
jgi:uncharacterized protein